MSERRKLSLRGPAAREDSPPRQSWNVSETRRERLKEMARAMRRNPSDAETALWARLSGQKVGGFKFHRQVVVGSTIVDFACPARWLVVEISGEANAEVAAIQDRKLTDVGIRVLRFGEAQVLEAHAHEDSSTLLAVPHWIPLALVVPSLALLCLCALCRSLLALLEEGAGR